MRFIFLLILLCLFNSCSQSSSENISQEENETQKKQGTTGENEKEFRVVQAQYLSSDQNQLGFSLMPVDSNGAPLKCDEANISFKIKTFHNSQLIENQSQTSVRCLQGQKSQIGLIIDNSGSVRDYRLLIENSVRNLVDQLSPLGSHISLTEVNTNARVLAPLSSDTDQIKNALSNMLNKGGWTALYDGIRLGHETLDEKVVFNDESVDACNLERKALIVLTDGNENNSQEQQYESYDIQRFPGDSIDTTIDDLKKLKIRSQKIPIFTIGVGNEADETSLKNISHDSGAVYRKLANFTKVNASFEQIHNYISAPYQFCIQPQEMTCGEYNVVVDYTSNNGPGGQKTIAFNIPCDQDSDSKDEEKEEEISQVIDEVSNEEKIESTSQDLNLLFSKKVAYPKFDNENNKKELIGVKLHFEAQKNLNLSSTSQFEIDRNSSFQIYTEDNQIINLSKNNSSTFKVEESFNDQQLLSGIYKVSSEHFPHFIGVDNNNFIFSAQDKFSWKEQKKISGSLVIKGHFIIEYVWRYRKKIGVIIPDLNLRAAVRNATGVRVGPISSESMQEIKDLNLSGLNITTFEGIQYASKIEKLNISQTNTRDIAFLSNLKMLKDIDLSNNEIDDFNYISKLNLLSKISLNKTNITDLTVLSQLPLLSEVNISNTQVLNIYPLVKTSVSHLTFQNCSLENYSSISLMDKLQTLDLSYCKKDPAATLILRNSQPYKNINLTNSNLSDLSRLKGHHIESLNISNNQLSSLDGIEQILELKTLNAYSNRFSDTELKQCLLLPSIRTLNFNSNLITKIDISKNIDTIRNLYLSNNMITDLSPLFFINGLKKVQLSNNEIVDLAPLESIVTLESIVAHRAPQKGILNLAALPALNYLDLRHTNLGDIAIDFSTFPSLLSLFLRYTNNVNLSLLTKDKIKILDIRNLDLTCEQQKEIVEKQEQDYEVRYELVENCPYIYQPGFISETVQISEQLTIGANYFGDFDGLGSLESMAGEYSTNFEPLVINSNERVESITAKLSIESILKTNHLMESNSSISLKHITDIQFVIDGEIISYKILDEEIPIELTSQSKSLATTHLFTPEITIPNEHIQKIMSTDSVDIILKFSSTPESIDQDENLNFSIDIKTSGSLKINYKIIKTSSK